MWVIVEIEESFMGTAVQVVGPFAEQRQAEMERRSRHIGRTLDPAVNASRVKSYTRELVSK